jgi:hypothetical protein
MDLSLLELGHWVGVLVTEDIRSEHQAHIVLVHLVLGCVLDETLHEVDSKHEGVSVYIVHLIY